MTTITIPRYKGQPRRGPWLETWSTVVHELASYFGWDAQQTSDALAALIDSESGWNPSARSPVSTAAGLIQWTIQPVRHEGQIVGYRKGPVMVKDTDRKRANERLNQDLGMLGFEGQLMFLPEYYRRILRLTPIARREKSSKHHAPTPWHMKAAGFGGMYLQDTSDDYRPSDNMADWVLYRGDREGLEAKAIQANPHAVDPQTGHILLGDSVARIHAHHRSNAGERLALPEPRGWEPPDFRIDFEEDEEIDPEEIDGRELVKKGGGGVAWVLLPLAALGGFFVWKHAKPTTPKPKAVPSGSGPGPDRSPA